MKIMMMNMIVIMMPRQLSSFRLESNLSLIVMTMMMMMMMMIPRQLSSLDLNFHSEYDDDVDDNDIGGDGHDEPDFDDDDASPTLKSSFGK